MSIAGRLNDPALVVELCGIPLKTPLIPAAGTLGKEVLDGLAATYGAMLPKTVTPQPRAGNPPPRVAEAPAGMVNSIGLQNPGRDRFHEDHDAYNVGLPLVVALAADTGGEFAKACERFGDEGRVAAVEANLSCPNGEDRGGAFCAGAPGGRGGVGARRPPPPRGAAFFELTNQRGGTKDLSPP